MNLNWRNIINLIVLKNIYAILTMRKLKILMEMKKLSNVKNVIKLDIIKKEHMNAQSVYIMSYIKPALIN